MLLKAERREQRLRSRRRGSALVIVLLLLRPSRPARQVAQRAQVEQVQAARVRQPWQTRDKLRSAARAKHENCYVQGQ